MRVVSAWIYEVKDEESFSNPLLEGELPLVVHWAQVTGPFPMGRELEELGVGVLYSALQGLLFVATFGLTLEACGSWSSMSCHGVSDTAFLAEESSGSSCQLMQVPVQEAPGILRELGPVRQVRLLKRMLASVLGKRRCQ